ncbi:notch receptor protein [Cryptosporidium ryanae]|uniref:notch receptor protein n=1 Tax=Cryptosporidium ryanae TaxID=515981 RepID=UPI00351A1696|nr:notch receptor protein [Cryptosporidium ryanae]
MISKFLCAFLTIFLEITYIICNDINVIPTVNITNIVPTIQNNIRNAGFPSKLSADKMRLKYPSCPSDCEKSWINDGWCDKECNFEECNNDGGDCIGWCTSECRPTWLGDGECDIDCFNSECNWDNNDCNDSMFEIRKKIVTGIKNKSNIDEKLFSDFDYNYCFCDKELLGNNICNVECNNIECNMDNGDCLHRCNSRCINIWLGDGQCDPSCDTKECFFDKGDCKSCSKNCRTWMIGNGICDYDCNNEKCSFDGGDCSNVCSVTKVDYKNQPLIYKFCLKSWLGDGYCDYDCNNESCNFDKGDCNSILPNEDSKSIFTYEAALFTPKRAQIHENNKSNIFNDINYKDKLYNSIIHSEYSSNSNFSHVQYNKIKHSNVQDKINFPSSKINNIGETNLKNEYSTAS